MVITPSVEEAAVEAEAEEVLPEVEPKLSATLELESLLSRTTTSLLYESDPSDSHLDITIMSKKLGLRSVN
jgi:hypothetical protein